MTTDPPAADLVAAVRELVMEMRQTRDPPALLNAEASAAFLSMGQSTFFRSVSAGTIPAAVKTPGGPRWKRSDLLKLVERMKPGRRRARAAK